MPNVSSADFFQGRENPDGADNYDQSNQEGDALTTILPSVPRAGAGIASSYAYLFRRAQLFPDLPQASLTVASRYVLVHKLGEGTMGAVFTAIDNQLGRKVALKVVRRFGEDGAKERLIREARNLARLNDPHVVQLYEVGEYRGEVFLAMEHVDGKPLDQWVADTKPSFRGLLEVLLAAGRGISAAHSKHLIHRDIKPANILVGVDGRTRVADFGLAWSEASSLAAQAEIGSRSAAMGNTSQGWGGTPAYMSPEQFRREEPDTRSDLFSFCVLAWELTYGMHPFPVATSADYAHAIRDGRIPSPKFRPRGVPARIERILRKGLATARAERYPDMRDLLDQLGRVYNPRTKIVALLLACLFALAAVGFYAYSQRSLASEQEALAKAQADTAERRLILAYNVVSDIMFVILPMYQSIPGTTEAQRDIRERLEEIIDTLQWSIHDGAKSARLRIMQIRRLAQLELLHERVDRAILHFREVVELARRLSLGHPGEVESQLLLAELLLDLGKAELEAGNVSAARGNYAESFQISSDIARGSSTEIKAQRLMAYYHSYMGNLEQSRGEISAARINYNRHLQISERLSRADSSDVGARQALSESLLSCGSMELQLGNLANASSHFKRAGLVLENLTEDDPNYSTTRRLHAEVARKLAAVAVRAGDFASARSSFERSLEALTEIEAQDPQSAWTKRSLSDLHQELGNLAVRIDDLHDARTHFNRSRRYCEELVSSDPRNLKNQRFFAQSLYSVGALELKMGDISSARQSLEHALRVEESIKEDISRSALAQSRVSIILAELGDLEVEADNLTRAREHHENAFRINEWLVGLDAKNVGARRALAYSYERLGDIDIKLGEAHSADVKFGRALELFKDICAIDVSNVQAQFDVIEAYLRLAKVDASREDFQALRGRLGAAEALLAALDRRGQAIDFKLRQGVRTRIRELATGREGRAAAPG